MKITLKGGLNHGKSMETSHCPNKLNVSIPIQHWNYEAKEPLKIEKYVLESLEGDIATFSYAGLVK